jgi:hypothetical protein
MKASSQMAQMILHLMNVSLFVSAGSKNTQQCYAEPQLSSVAGVAVRNVEIVDHPTTNHTSELLLDVTNHSDSPLLCAANSALSSSVQLGPATSSYLG